MKIAIIGGTGKLGMGFLARLQLTPHEVAVGSRDASKGMLDGDAAAWCDAALVTVPYAAHRAIVSPLKDALRGKVVIDTTVPINPENFFRITTESGNSAAEETNAM